MVSAVRVIAIISCPWGRCSSSETTALPKWPLAPLTPIFMSNFNTSFDNNDRQRYVTPDQQKHRCDALKREDHPLVALTPRGKDLIVSAFRKHSGQMKRVFSELSPEELRGLEVTLKKVGKRAAALMDES